MTKQSTRALTISREAYDVVVAMKLGLGSNRVAKGLGITHAAVLSRQNTLERLGVISKGTMGGQRRAVLLPDSAYRVEAEHRQTVVKRAATDRAEAAAREERLAQRESKLAARRATRLAAKEAARVAESAEREAARVAESAEREAALVAA